MTIMTGGDPLSLRIVALALAIGAASQAAAQPLACAGSAAGIARVTQSEDISPRAASAPRILDHNETDLFEVDCNRAGAMTGVRMRPLFQPLRREFLDLAATVIQRLAPRAANRSEIASLVERCMAAPQDRAEAFSVNGTLRARCAGAPRVLTLTLR